MISDKKKDTWNAVKCLKRTLLIIVSYCRSRLIKDDAAIKERRWSSCSTKQLENDCKWIKVSIITLRWVHHAKETFQHKIKSLSHVFKLTFTDFHKHYIFFYVPNRLFVLILYMGHYNIIIQLFSMIFFP